MPLVRSLHGLSARHVGLLLTLAVALVSSACQTGPKAMSIEEAKQVAASFTGSSFVPPPRTINDITAILDQQKRANPEAAAAARAKADQPPRDTTDRETLAKFYYERGLAAREIGRAKQEIEDLTRALSYSGSVPGDFEIRLLHELSNAEMAGGNYSRAMDYTRQAMWKATGTYWRGWLITLNGKLALIYASWGDLNAAEAALRDALIVYAESQRWMQQRPEWISGRQAQVARAQAAVLAAKGRYAEAEAFQRRAVAALAEDPVWSQNIDAPGRWNIWLDYEIGRLAQYLARQGRLLEAENEARMALLGALSKRGRYSTQTAIVLRNLIQVIFEQGRYAEAETLAHARIDIYEKSGSAPESVLLAGARADLASALGAQGRWREALAEYEAIRTGLAGDPQYSQKFFSGHVGWAVALLNTGQPDRALEPLHAALERSQQLVGDKHKNTGGIRGLLARAYADKGDRPRALREFREATQLLLTPSPDVDDESTTRAAQDQRLGMILTSYIGLLSDIKGTPLEKQAGVEVAAEAFRLAEVVRGQSVQRALDASAARAAAKTPALADLVRQEQDTKKQVTSLNSLLANVLSAPTEQQNPKVMAELRGQIDALGRARLALAEQIAKEFPAYAQLVNPAPATLEQARATLRAGEALISTLVTRERTFVWAVPSSGLVAFATAPIGAKALETAVTKLRTALDPSAKTLGEIPEFDLASAHKLYSALLEPVADGWKKADNLLIVGHGPLGQLPFALLPTRPTTLGPEQGAIFANYRAVPWLVRTHAVTVLPSVTALATLRALPSGDPQRRPFVGFGDPYFSQEQASRATRESGQVQVAALSVRGVPITLRSSPKTQSFDSSQLAMLPRLPDTADEIRGIALAMDADLTRDVFIGAQANEKNVKTLDLSRYRVIAFATHGLIPGDLDGLTQPALALTAPDVAQIEGDGLLTMEKILALRLNADWVVLSACNTASGKGAGSEAVSGLGRAFFYAGARALLVSNWPVETTSARALTTELFRRQKAEPSLTRAKALQQTMNWLIDGPGLVDPKTNTIVFSYAHPIFWAPFSLVGDGGSAATEK